MPETYLHKCRWPGMCPHYASTLIGTTRLRPFHVCATHAATWRSLSYLQMADTHARLERPRRTAIHKTVLYDYGNN